MCTAITYQSKYFGRNLDLEHSYHERVTITPRNFPLHFRKMPHLKTHFAIIGMATVADKYPLYYDATNEKGLSIAGLNFPGNAAYHSFANDKYNLAPFELIPWLLGQCATVSEAYGLLQHTNILKESFSTELPLTPLHWMLADQNKALTIEPMKDGLHIFENPVGVLTNNPPFEMQMFSLNNYLNLSREKPENRFSDKLTLQPYSRGMGALGLPGDLSSPSRFVRAVFTKLNSVAGTTESESISQFFHILGAVAQQRGCVHLGENKYECTLYSSCCNTEKGIYYYTTYENSQICGVDMQRENLDGQELMTYSLITGQQIHMQNITVQK